MKGLIQRVSEASVVVEGHVVGEIGRGLLLFLGIEKADSDKQVSALLHKVVNYRVFPDARGHMNLSLLDVAGQLLVVSQFTLVADTQKGLRPSFSSAADPETAEFLYDQFVREATALCATQSGSFGADMKVQLRNDGPVTFLLKS